MSKLPRSVQNFVAAQTTVPVESLWEPGERFFLYGAYWYRAIASLLLSGRVPPKYGGSPNMTDLTRVCKEANIDEYAIEPFGTLLVAGRVLKTTLRDSYEDGPNAEQFWQRAPEGLRAMGRDAVLTVAHGPTNDYTWLDPKAQEMHTLDLIAMFFRCFKGKAIPENQVIAVLSAFCALPEEELAKVAEGIGLENVAVHVAGWRRWLESAKAGKALMAALYLAEWAYADRKPESGPLWWFPSPTGLAMLGLEKAGRLPPLPEELTVSPEGVVRAGTGLGPDKLVPLFRHCAFKKMANVLEFQVERKRLTLEPAGTAPGEELRNVLESAGPLPEKLEETLGTESKLGGKVGVRWCSALVQPQNATVLKAIRQHPQLKNYLEVGAPTGFLLIKAGSRPDNFVRRCTALGFEVKIFYGAERLED